MPTNLSTTRPLPPATHQRSTRDGACRVAARWSKVRYRQILQLLADRGRLCMFEVPAILSVQEQKTIHDHQISGRFYPMVYHQLIRKPGIRRPTPTGCTAEVYEITLAGLAELRNQTSGSDALVGPSSNAVQTEDEENREDQSSAPQGSEALSEIPA